MIPVVEQVEDVRAYKKIWKGVVDEHFIKLKENGIYVFDRIVSQLGFSTDVDYNEELLEETIKGTIVSSNKLEQYIYYNLYKILSPTKDVH